MRWATAYLELASGVNGGPRITRSEASLRLAEILGLDEFTVAQIRGNNRAWAYTFDGDVPKLQVHMPELTDGVIEELEELVTWDELAEDIMPGSPKAGQSVAALGLSGWLPAEADDSDGALLELALAAESAAVDESRSRKCMSCAKPFKSFHGGHRVCDTCKKSWRAIGPRLGESGSDWELSGD
jgi:hypothetical protein